MNILITGITGFVGSHLAEYFLQNHKDAKVFGLTRWRSDKSNICHILDKITLIEGDLTDLSSLLRTLKMSKPDFIYHLAAQSYVPYSFHAPAATLDSNCIGTCNLFEAIKILNKDGFIDPMVHCCSSSECYGQVTADEIPIKETNILRPASPYAVSKVCEDMLAFQYHISWGLKIVRTRMFTHSGARRNCVFAESNFAYQIARIENGVQEPILKVGNLESIRTFADVKDTVRAYWMLLNKCTPGEVYNIGGNRTMKVGEMLQCLLSQTSCKIKVEVDPQRLRPSDVTLQIPDCTKFKNQTGWEPEIPFEDTMKDLLNYWRSDGNYAKY